MDFSNWTSQDIMIIIIAAWGAILGTYAGVLSTVQLIQRTREKSSRLKIKMTVQLFSDNDKERGNVSAVAYNKGENEVSLHFPGLLYSWSRFRRPRTKGLFLLSLPEAGKYPIDLKPRNSHAQSFELSRVAEELHKARYSGIKKIRAEYKDALGKIYLSDTYNFDIDRWLQRDKCAGSLDLQHEST